MELFNTFYDDYIEYKHYVNDVIQNISSNKELGNSFKDETKSQQSKTKLLPQETQTLKNENKDLKEENKSHLKIIELLSAGHDSDNPLRNYRNYNLDLHNKSRLFYLLKLIYMEFSKNGVQATTYRSET